MDVDPRCIGSMKAVCCISTSTLHRFSRGRGCVSYKNIISSINYLAYLRRVCARARGRGFLQIQPANRLVKDAHAAQLLISPATLTHFSSPLGASYRAVFSLRSRRAEDLFRGGPFTAAIFKARSSLAAVS